MASPGSAPHEEPFTATAELASDAADDGNVRIIFRAQGETPPAIWSPSFGGPRPMPMQEDGPKLWKLETRLPKDACASWAAIPNMRAAAPSRSDKLRLLLSTQARVDLGTKMDDQFIVNNATAPSLYRLIGTDPQRRLTPNIGLIPTPESDAPNNDGLCAPAPTGDEQHIRGHRLVKIGDDEPEALLLDGELLRRTDAELADTGWARSYLHNRGAAARLTDHARPDRFARIMAPLLRNAGCTPQVIVGTSAAAPTALALALRMESPQVVLLSPAFLDERIRRQLITDAAARGIRIDVRAGSEETGGGDPNRSIRQQAETFTTAVREAGGNAAFTQFSGGHDLPAWHFAQLRALREAAKQQQYRK